MIRSRSPQRYAVPGGAGTSFAPTSPRRFSMTCHGSSRASGCCGSTAAWPAKIPAHHLSDFTWEAYERPRATHGTRLLATQNWRPLATDPGEAGTRSGKLRRTAGGVRAGGDRGPQRCLRRGVSLRFDIVVRLPGERRGRKSPTAASRCPTRAGGSDPSAIHTSARRRLPPGLRTAERYSHLGRPASASSGEDQGRATESRHRDPASAEAPGARTGLPIPLHIRCRARAPYWHLRAQPADRRREWFALVRHYS